MANELLEGFAGHFDTEIVPVLGESPGITSLGMASLLPGAEKGLSIEAFLLGITVSIEGRPMKDRTARLTWISERAGVPALTLKLSDIVRLTPKRKKDLAEAGLIAVTSQEIDRLGEEGAEEAEMRIFMDEVLEKLRRGIRNLASAGLNVFVISADHGFIFAEGLELVSRWTLPAETRWKFTHGPGLVRGGLPGKDIFVLRPATLNWVDH